MKLKVAVQMDPIARINVRGDSTFALLLEAQKRGHAISYYTPDKLSLRGKDLVAPVQSLTVRDQEGDHFTLGEIKREYLESFDVVLLRQDPPFDLAYITSTHFLERIHPKTLVVNDPTSVRDAPEKLFVMNFPELMPPTLISRDLDEINSFRAEHGAVVMKPLHGHGGAAVFRVMPQDMNFGSLFDMFSVTFREPWVIQRFLPEVKQGDKRIILVNGEFAGAVNRVPAADDLRSNMVRGGAAQATDLTPREREICERVGPALRERGLLFVGIDVIDGNLTEINVTSPTGIRAMTEADLNQCATLCRKVHGFDRTGELRGAMAMKLFRPYVLERRGRVVAYATGPEMFVLNHGVAESETDLRELLVGACAANDNKPLSLLVPTRRSDFFRWCLSEGLRIAKPFSLMAMGDYREPNGPFFPSVAY